MHLEEGQRVEAEELPPISIEGKGPRVLALCPEHKRDYYDPFMELVEDLAQEMPEEEAPSGTSKKSRKETPQQEERTAEDETQDDESAEEDESAEDDASDQEEASSDDPDQIVAESPAMTVVPDQPDTARWDCPMDDCEKTYSASGGNRAEDLKRLGNLHLSTAHHLDKAARIELLSA
jgi:hypothetical protein